MAFRDNEPTEAKTMLVGWRGWTLVRPHYLLSGNWIWPIKGELEASCNIAVKARIRGRHENDDIAPVAGCSCGIYAFKTPGELRDQTYNNQDVLGEVWLWGKIHEHTKGFKAQYAYPKKLYYKAKSEDNSTREHAEYTAWTYGVPIEIIDEDHDLFSNPATKEAALRAKAAREAAQKFAADLKQALEATGNVNLTRKQLTGEVRAALLRQKHGMKHSKVNYDFLADLIDPPEAKT